MDDLLRDAAASDNFKDLPGKGRPLDLNAYFAAGEEHRVTHRLLKDNNILPQHLQDRKDAEDLERASRELFAREKEGFGQLHAEIRQVAQTLMAAFPDRQTLLQGLGLTDWPFDFPDPAAASTTDLSRLLQQAHRLRRLTARYNRRAGAFISRYLDLLQEAQERVGRYKKQIIATGRLFTGFTSPPSIDIPAREQEIREAIPLLPPLPEDLADRLRAYLKKTRPPFWTRLRAEIAERIRF